MALIVGMTVFVSDEIARRLGRGRSSNALGSIFFRSPNAIAGAVLVIMAARLLPDFVTDLVTMQRDPDMIAARQESAEIDGPFWSKVRALRIDRLVLTAPELSLKALRYGRLPIALDTTAIDFIPYLPRAATALGTLVERGYGVSFFHPPAVFRFGGVLVDETGRDYWACLAPGQWKAIASEFGIAALLVPADWTVRLPLLLSDGEYALYAMPAGTSLEVVTSTGSAEPSCPVWRDQGAPPRVLQLDG
jgi:hypothetical protein